MRKVFYDLVNDLVHYGKSDKRFIDATNIEDFPNLAEAGVYEDFETVGSA